MTIQEYEPIAQAMLDSIGKLVARAPADQLDWRPVPSCMTLGELLQHSATAVTPMIAMAVTGDMGPEMTPEELQAAVANGDFLSSVTVDEAVKLVAEQKAALTELLAQCSPEDWTSVTRTMPWGTSGTISCLAVEAIDHGAGHRYQLFMYLKLLGQELHTAHLYGMA